MHKWLALKKKKKKGGEPRAAEVGQADGKTITRVLLGAFEEWYLVKRFSFYGEGL